MSYFLIGVAGGDGEHVRLLSEHLGPVPLAVLHPVLKMVLVIRVEGLDKTTTTRSKQNSKPKL